MSDDMKFLTWLIGLPMLLIVAGLLTDAERWEHMWRLGKVLGTAACVVAILLFTGRSRSDP